MKSARCPACGAPVTFRSAASLYAVCEYCKSTLLRQGQDLANLGRMAELVDDPTVIRLGTEGKLAGHHFGVIGRIQLQYADGLWNEWHILFDDGAVAWLSEAGGQYTVTRQVQVSDPMPAFEALAPEQVLTLGNQRFQVTDLETGMCIAWEGELPFKLDSGYDLRTADLRNGPHFATIDYSETPPLVFMGQSVAFGDLALTGLREQRDAKLGGEPRGKAKALDCPQCGAPIQLHSDAILTVACPSCGTVVDTDDTRAIAQAAAEMAREKPALPLGAKGSLGGIEWEIIGFMRRRTVFEGTAYAWSEYLLFHAGEGFAWLTEEGGHWNFLRPVDKPPMVSRDSTRFKWEGADWRLYNRGRAQVTFVLGEFYWRVRVGDDCATADFVSGSSVLSREITERETSWSRGEYQEPDVIWQAFKADGPKPYRRTVAGNQPNSWVQPTSRVWRLFWVLILLATAVQVALMFRDGSRVVLNQTLVFAPDQDEPVLSQPFRLDGTTRTLEVRHNTNLDNNWVSLATTLVNKDTGQAFQGHQELSYYFGRDGGESWSEGSNGTDLTFRNLPAGNYYLTVDCDIGDDKPAPVQDALQVEKNTTVWSNYVLLLVFLLVFPLFARWRRNAFEANRWEESGIGSDAPSDDGGDGGAGGGGMGLSDLAGAAAGAVIAGVLESLTEN